MLRLFRSAIASIMRKVRARAVAKAARTRGANLRIARGISAAKSALIALAEEAEGLIQEASEEAEQIISQAFGEALETMAGMTGNAGQDAVYESQVVPAFLEAYANSDIEDGWNDVNIGEYMAFMGEIVGEGNDIMSAAYAEAGNVLDSADDEVSSLEEQAYQSDDGEELEEPTG